MAQTRYQINILVVLTSNIASILFSNTPDEQRFVETGMYLKIGIVKKTKETLKIHCIVAIEKAEQL